MNYSLPVLPEDLMAVARLFCVDGASLPLNEPRPSWLTAVFDEVLRDHQAKGKFLQMPSFHGAQAIGIFSDYGGSHKQSPVETYTFLFADFGALGSFDAKVKEARQQARLSLKHEIAFKELGSRAVLRTLPGLLQAADQVPGLLFTLVVNKRVPSVIVSGPNPEHFMRSQLSGLGFTSWQSRGDAERLLRVLHTVSYWLSMLGRSGLKTFWMTDNDSILGRSSAPGEFSQAYLRALALFGPPDFPIIGTATSFTQTDPQPFPHELVSLADLVAGAWAAHFTAVGGNQLHDRKRPAVDQILGFLAHQSVFLKKMTLTVDVKDDQSVGYGLASVSNGNTDTSLYTAVEF